MIIIACGLSSAAPPADQDRLTSLARFGDDPSIATGEDAAVVDAAFDAAEAALDEHPRTELLVQNLCMAVDAALQTHPDQLPRVSQRYADFTARRLQELGEHHSAILARDIVRLARVAPDPHIHLEDVINMVLNDSRPAVLRMFLQENNITPGQPLDVASTTGCILEQNAACGVPGWVAALTPDPESGLPYAGLGRLYVDVLWHSAVISEVRDRRSWQIHLDTVVQRAVARPKELPKTLCVAIFLDQGEHYRDRRQADREVFIDALLSLHDGRLSSQPVAFETIQTFGQIMAWDLNGDRRLARDALLTLYPLADVGGQSLIHMWLSIWGYETMLP